MKKNWNKHRNDQESSTFYFFSLTLEFLTSLTEQRKNILCNGIFNLLSKLEADFLSQIFIASWAAILNGG